MIVNEQKPIEFINNCGCIVHEKYLASAIKWFAKGRPLVHLKKIFIYGKYPAVSIYEQKIHIHRLIYMYLHNRKLDRCEYIHHRDNNRLNALMENLQLQSSGEHQRITNQGHKQTSEHIAKRIDATTQTRYGHSIYENPELLEAVK